MGTRSTIAVKNSTGTISAIYCHWDGYISNNGVILLENYATAAKVKELIALGGISSLGKEIGEKQSFDSPEPDTTVAYTRDRGEAMISHCFTDAQSWIAEFGEEYNYMFVEGQWLVNDHQEEDSEGFPVFTDLEHCCLHGQ